MPKPLKPSAVKLLERVIAHIEEEPKRFDIAQWGYKKSKLVDGPACGTVACIAGWTLLLHARPDERAKSLRARSLKGMWTALGLAWDDYGGVLDTDIGVRVAKLLDITNTEADRLFLLTSWPEPYRSRYIDAKLDPIARGAVAVERIRRFIRTRT